MAEVVIRRFAAGDHDAVRELFVTVNRDLAPVSLRDQFADYIDLALREEIDRIDESYDRSRRSGFWVAADHGSVVGMFGLEAIDGSTVELRRMYVDPRMRRRGIARLMLEHAESSAAQAGFTKLVLSTSELQQAAIALYRAAGYRLIREEIATATTNKTVGGGITRYYFEKPLH
jgi:ribosomal protein S18 acetylase RimI-like enzyme